MADSIRIYISQLETLEEISDPSEFKAAVLSYLSYALRGEDQLPEGAMARMFYKMSRPLADAQHKASEDGAKGGRPPKEKEKGVSETEKGGFLNKKTGVSETESLGFPFPLGEGEGEGERNREGEGERDKTGEREKDREIEVQEEVRKDPAAEKETAPEARKQPAAEKRKRKRKQDQEAAASDPGIGSGAGDSCLLDKEEDAGLLEEDPDPIFPYGVFNNVLLPFSKYQELLQEYGSIPLDQEVNKLSSWWKIHPEEISQDHYATLILWLNRDGIRPKDERELGNGYL